MKLGTKIKQARIRQGLTQIELSEKTGLTERTIQRIENHEVEPSKHSLNKIGRILDLNLNELKSKDMTKKQNILNIFLASISILIVIEFLIGWLTWEQHWWVPMAWFFPLLGGVSIPYLKTPKKTPVTAEKQKNIGLLLSLLAGGILVVIGILLAQM